MSTLQHTSLPPARVEETVGFHLTPEDESRGAAVLLDEYAADPEPQRSSSGAPRMPVGNERFGGGNSKIF